MSHSPRRAAQSLDAQWRQPGLPGCGLGPCISWWVGPFPFPQDSTSSQLILFHWRQPDLLTGELLYPSTWGPWGGNPKVENSPALFLVRFLAISCLGAAGRKSHFLCQSHCPCWQLSSVLLNFQSCGPPGRGSVERFPQCPWSGCVDVLGTGVAARFCLFVLGSSSSSSSRWCFLSGGVSSDHGGVMAKNLFPLKTTGSIGLSQEISNPPTLSSQA